MLRALEIIRKDLRLLLRDRRALVTLLALPLVFITIIGLTTGKLLGWHQTNATIRVAYVDEVEYQTFDDLPASQLLRDETHQHNLVTKIINTMQQWNGIQMIPAPSRAEANRMTQGRSRITLEDGSRATADGILVIGPEFAKRVSTLELRDLSPSRERLKNGLADLDMQVDSEHPDSSAQSLMTQLILATTVKTLSRYMFCSYEANPAERAQIVRECRSLIDEGDQPAIAALPPKKPSAEGGADIIYERLIPGYTVMFVFFLVNIMARSFIHERELGTLRRLRIAPLSTSSLLSGKTVPFLVISLMQTVLLFIGGRILFGMEWGPNPWMLLPVIMFTSLAATALGLLVSTIVRTESQVSAYANFVVIGMAGISGCFMPREWLPHAMQEASLYTPHAWALIAYEQLLAKAQPDINIVLEACGMLMGFAILFFVLGCLRFNKVE